MHGEMEGAEEKTVMALFKILFQNSPGRDWEKPSQSV